MFRFLSGTGRIKIDDTPAPGGLARAMGLFGNDNVTGENDLAPAAYADRFTRAGDLPLISAAPASHTWPMYSHT